MVPKPILKYFRMIFPCFLSFSLHGNDQQSSYPEITEIESGIFKFGLISIDKVNRAFSFPAVCNQTSGLIEYALVHENGKVHESLYRTSVTPKLIHATLLLLKVEPLANFFKISSTERLHYPSYKTIQIFAEWEQNRTIITKDISTMVLNQTNGKSLTPNAFVFTGSKVIEGIYIADQDGSIVAVYHDSRATINSRDQQSDADDVWIANYANMPPKEFPVMIRFQLPNSG